MARRIAGERCLITTSRELAGAEPEALAKRTIAKVGWRLLPFLLLLYIVAWLDRVNISIAALQMNKPLGFRLGGVRVRRRHFLRELCAVRAAEQLDPRAGRRAPLDRANHDHLGRGVGRRCCS